MRAMTTVTAESRYQQLITRIEKIYLDARQESKKRVNQVILDAYRRIGRQIVEVEQGRQLRAAYGERLLDSLSEDLTERFGPGFSVSNLRYMRQFYLAYRDQETKAELPWTHYRSLLSIKDPDLRDYYARQATTHEWSARELDRYLKIDKVDRERLSGSKNKRVTPIAAPEARLTVTRGGLYTFAVINAPMGGILRTPLLIDCGFRIYREMTYRKIGPLKNGDVVVSKKSAAGFSIRRCEDQSAPRFFYKAVIERIIDGDTLLCVIDTGFDNWTRQRLRLRDISIPELNTGRGRKAKSFVQEALRECPCVVVNTHPVEKNGGYLADLYYLPGSGDGRAIAVSGRFLNQDLIDQGLASLA